MRLRIAGVQVINEDGDRLRSVPRCFQRLQAYASEFENGAIAKRRECIRRFGRGAQIDGGTYAIAQLQMPCDEIGMEMRQEYVFDSETVFTGKGNILVGVALWVDDRCHARLLVSNNVGSVRQARQIKLFNDHGLPPSLANCYFGWATILR